MHQFTYNRIKIATSKLNIINYEKAKENYDFNVFWDKVNRSPDNFDYVLNDLTEETGQRILLLLDNLNGYGR